MIGVSFTFSDLIQTYRDAIRNSVEIEDFCQENYGLSLKVAIGHDERREWGEADAPFIIMVPTSRSTGLSVAMINFGFDIDLAIKDDVFNDFEDNNITEMRGVYKLDELSALVEDALVQAGEGKNLVTDSIDIQYNSSMFFPLHVATINISISIDNIFNGTLGI